MQAVDQRNLNGTVESVSTKAAERGLAFDCAGDRLLGVVALPSSPGDVGVIVVVGGPQYRVGSHRQFVHLARTLAHAGFPTLRFDYRGMGDSEGETRSFEDVSLDIQAAIAALEQTCPTVSRIVLWGLCDGASASLIYVDQMSDERVQGLVLANPWVRADSTFAKTAIKHYYLNQLVDRQFWNRLFTGNVRLADAFKDFVRTVRNAMDFRGPRSAPRSFRDRMVSGMASFHGPVLIVLSGRDLTAREFSDYARTHLVLDGTPDRQRIERCDLPLADHTFSDRLSRDAVEDATAKWLERHFTSGAR